ncbi:glutamate ABC transporter substrate-binding protein [Nocardia sp. NPDC006044]|uniref:glutamate ABC transporter substrate-binding protein n=1 Tax=Nocardia sp. NPDC006044 TaxID=3364306 RepID=UPI0036CD9AFC
MRCSRPVRLGIGVAVAVAMSACGHSGSDTAVDHAREGRLTIGIKFDQPGLSMKDTDGTFRGFDVEVAKYVAGKLGVQADGITFKEAPSARREALIADGAVDFVVATYSITPDRKEKVDFAGPYFVAGQALLVKTENVAISSIGTLTADKRLCSVEGSTSAANVKEVYAKEAQLLELSTYSQCVEALRAGTVDAVTTDDIILAGFAGLAPGELAVVGETFTVENYGIGLKKGDRETRGKINDAIEDMIADGSWKRAFEETIGPLAASTLTPPVVDRY